MRNDANDAQTVGALTIIMNQLDGCVYPYRMMNDVI